MQPHRRAFLTSALASSAAALATAPSLDAGAGAGSGAKGREYYDLRSYRLKPGASADLLDGYLERALLPALGRLGIGTVGVFTEIDVDKAAGTSAPKPDTPVWVLIAHPTLESFVTVSGNINDDPAVRDAGRAYLDAPKDTPAFDRIDCWLLRAFAGHPTLERPPFSTARVPTRVFEMRDYESHTELKALVKIGMFDAEETALMRDLGMSPVLYGQALAGPNLPHLRYITSGPDLATHLAGWKRFAADPRWHAMRDLPKYKDSTSKNTARFLVPRPYSAI